MSFHTKPMRGAIAGGYVLLTAALVLGSLILMADSIAAQCSQNPTGETAVGLRNASSYFLTFYIDGRNEGGVPSGDRSVDFVVSPGEHTLRADAVINGETVSASRQANIPAGYVCTWVVTNPPPPAEAKKRMIDSQMEPPLIMHRQAPCSRGSWAGNDGRHYALMLFG